MALHLIDVPADFYNDELFFKKPDELSSIFGKLEESSLSQIHHLQEQEQALEMIHEKELDLRNNLQATFDEQNKSKIELQQKINVSKLMLSALQRKTTSTIIFEQVPGSIKDKGKPKQAAVDFAAILKILRGKIKAIHKKSIGQGEVEGKETIQLLNVSPIITPFLILITNNLACLCVGNRGAPEHSDCEGEASAAEGPASGAGAWHKPLLIVSS